jgi:DNA-binding response OmpR family regulator
MTRRTVFLLDDSKLVLDAAKETLEARGYDVRATANIAELEHELQTVRPDLFVLDVYMPEMFGDDVAQVLRDIRKLDVPIVLFSDVDEASLVERGREAGVQACVPKHAGLPALVAQVDALLGVS